MQPAGKRAPGTGGGGAQSLLVSVVTSLINWTTLDTSGKTRSLLRNYLHWIGLWACLSPQTFCWLLMGVGHPTSWRVVLGGVRRARDLLLGQEITSCSLLQRLPRVPALAFFRGKLWPGDRRKYIPPRAGLGHLFTTGSPTDNLGKSPISFCMWEAFLSHLKTEDSFPHLPGPSSIAWC